MKLSFLPSFFKDKEDSLIVPDSLLLKKIKSLSQNSNLLIYSHVEIYHHKTSYLIPLMIYDNLRGIYIFEIKKWSYDDLKHATASKAESVENSKDTLAYDKTHAIIKNKFNELLHNDGVDIFNYLLMENLSSTEYEHLNDSLKEILPQEKIIFSDSQTAEIFKKLQDAAGENYSLPSNETVLGTLLSQYTIIDQDHNLHLCNEEEIQFIDTKITGTKNLIAPPKSGKSSAILLKSIKELFKQKRKKIIIIKPTVLSRDLLYKQFLELIEHAIVEIDLAAFEILTPIELVNKHLSKLKMPALDHTLYIDQKLMKKSFDTADLLICDDANFMPKEFIDYIMHIQNKTDLLLVNYNDHADTISFTKSYVPENRKIEFHQTNPHAKALHLISTLLQSNSANEIVVISDVVNRENLRDDLISFIEDKALLIDASKHLLDQKLDSLLLLTYDDIIDISAKHVILLDLSLANEEQVEYAFNMAKDSVYILYEQECPTIETLKESHEDNKN